MTEKPLLVIHHGALGDMMTVVPSLLKLKRNVSAIDVICSIQNGRLLQELGVCRNRYSVDSPLVASLYTGVLSSEAVDFLQSFQEILVFSFSEQVEKTLKNSLKAAVRRIPPRPNPHHKVLVSEYILHQTDALFSLPFGFPSEVFSDKRSQSYDRNKVIVHPGSGSKRKNWGIENFNQLCRLIRSSGMTPEVILGPADLDLAAGLKHEAFVAVIRDIIDLIRLLKTAAAFVGNDSGVSHLAGYLGLSAIVIFGPSDSDRWKPIGRNVAILEQRPNCNPCFEIETKNCENPVCLSDITPEMAFDLLRRIV